MNSSSAMVDLKLLLLEQVVALRRHKWIALAACWMVCLAGWGAVMMLPRRYESDARAFVDINGLLTPLLKGMVVDTTGGQQNTDYVRQTLLSRPNLEQVIHVAQLDIGKTDAQKDALVTSLASSVQVRAQAKNLFTISYTADNPQTTKNVVDALLTIFAEKAASSSRVEMEKAHKFLDDQIASYEDQLRAAEQRRADFRKQYADYIADPNNGTPRLQVLQLQATQARQAYDQALLTRTSLETQLKQVPQYRTLTTPVGLGPDGRVIPNALAARLAAAKQTLELLRLKFTDQYPEVIAAQNEVNEFQTQYDQASAAAAAAASANPQASTGETNGVMTTTTEVANPTYDQIRLKLVDIETTIPALKQRLDEAVADFEKGKAKSGDIPDIDAKAKDLDRDYDIVKKNHDELVARRESANLSQAADDQADRTQFRIVDPPQVPLNPSFPNLPIMFSIVLLISIGAGVTLPIAIEFVSATFASAGRLRGLGLPVIGSVTFVRRPGSTRRFVGTVGIVAAGSALLVVYGALIFISSSHDILL